MVLVAALLGFASVVRGETAYFLMGSPSNSVRGNGGLQAYVVPVTDAAVIAQARAYLNSGPNPLYFFAHVRIAAGADGINQNYAQPGQTAWDWHVVELLGWSTFDPRLPRTTDWILTRDGSPVDVPSILAGEGTPALIDPVSGKLTRIGPPDEMGLIYYPVLMELTPGKTASVHNVSTRGYVGSGERVLIAGFVVAGAAPRNVLVRALGPSLAAFGVTEPLTDPSIDIYHGSQLIATNDDWQTGNLGQEIPAPAGMTAPFYAWLAPLNAKEPSLRLMLPPGAYTMIVRSNAGGIALAEVYDLDAIQ